MQTAYVLPLTVLALVLAVASLGFRASRRRGYGPFVVGVMASFAVILEKFVIDSNTMVYGAVAILVAASLWNAWPKPTTGVSSAPAGTLQQIESIEKEK